MLSFDKDFLFELNNRKYSLTLYAYIVDAGLFFIIVKNKTEKSLRIPRNFRLGKIAKIYFDEYYYVDIKYEDLINLAARRFKSIYKSS